MNTRSKKSGSESGYVESDRLTSEPLHRIHEESPRSPSTIATTSGAIPLGRKLPRSPPRMIAPQYGAMETARLPLPVAPGTSHEQQLETAESTEAITEQSSCVGLRPRTHQHASPTRSHRSQRSRRDSVSADEEDIASTSKLVETLRLQIELANLQLERLTKKKSRRDTAESRVQEWMDGSEVDPQPEEAPPPVNAIRGEGRRRGELATENPPQGRNMMMRMAAPYFSLKPRPDMNLPDFTGIPEEWLSFKKSMEESTMIYEFTPQENFIRLRRALKGKAKETVQSYLNSNSHPDEVMEILEQEYGRPELLIEREFRQIADLPEVTANLVGLESLSVKVANVISTIKSFKDQNYLHDSWLKNEIISKLGPQLIHRWKDYGYANQQSVTSKGFIVVLSEFLKMEVNKSRAFATRPNYLTEQRRKTVKGRVYATYEDDGETSATNAYARPAKDCFKCHSDKHNTSECPALLKLDVNDRWEWAKAQRVCFKCMNKKHSRNICRAKPCRVDGCKFSHHAILHNPEGATTSSRANEARRKRERPTEEIVNVASTVIPESVLLKTCEVKISGPRGEITTFALLDEGSTVTLIEEDLANKIATEGSIRPLSLKGINQHRIVDSKTVHVRVKGQGEKRTYPITARTIPKLDLHQQRSPTDISRYSHLKGISRHVCLKNATPQLLIGADNWHLIVSRQLRTGKRHEPAASWTKLGWVLHGTIPNVTLVEDHEAVLHIRTQAEDYDKLERIVEKHFQIDSLGVANKQRISERDRKAIDSFEATASRKDGYFEVGLPWGDSSLALPDSYEQAYKRFISLELKMKRSPALKNAYAQQMKNLFDKGYATTCDGDEDKSSIKWYLPHFAVTNPNKPGKVRLVFDAAAKTRGVCLNDFLLEGPDLLASLTKILFRFRERKIAVTADIEEMFLRIKIRKEDQPAQMFLWRDRPNGEIKQYKMRSMIFGASSSPFLAHSVRNRNAADYQEEYPEAARAIQERHYMDDYLDSFGHDDEAIRTIREVIQIHEKAGFNLRGWNSNSSAVLAEIPATKRSANTNVSLAKSIEQPEKTLGLRWNPRTDTLGFNTAINKVPTEVKLSQRAPTKREALSAVMSIYDPLGLISHYTITGKIILQRLWAKKTGWDERIPAEEANHFQEWLEGLPQIASLNIGRCYSPDVSRSTRIELHVFTDASEQAYATAAYWRIEHKDGGIRTALVMAKAKVAPLKIQTIPRLELQGALLGARVADTITREHSLKPHRIVFWTDSRTVFHWIQNDGKKYTPFVAHRLAEIAELSGKTDWRWVPTYLNPADNATRLTTDGVVNNHMWFDGPSFLKRGSQEWPKMEDRSEYTSTEVALTIETSREQQDVSATLPDITRFSSHQRLIRATAVVRLFIDKLRSKNKSRTLEVSHLEDASTRWVKLSQRESFGDEVRRLKTHQPLAKGSRLYKLGPFIDEDGVVKARGRIGATDVSTCAKNPVIIDGRHPYVQLLIRQYHHDAQHANNERVVNELRQRYIVLHLRPVVRRTAKECQHCRIYKAAARTPPTGDLPRARLDPGHRAFTNCGVDYFGPMTVTVGRRHEKRWGALFTCLTTRAVHLELVPSLSTDSAIMAIRRMAARRGWPRMMYSDNATNFRGADAELRKAYAAWEPELRDFGLHHGMDWRFNPPGAPHMGGAWERLVRSVKTALKTTLKERSPKEEVLQTLLVEAEYSVNARPLTHVSVDPADCKALTPNHFLLGSSTGLPATGPCEDVDRNTWRKAQALADHFWRRWI